MDNYKKINNITGWVVFAIATWVYVMTVEPTASFWDCGEFIGCSYKLQVPHPPGAPFFLLIGRMFSMLALGNVYQVAHWINILSALCGSFTSLFIFWTITILARKLIYRIPQPESLSNTISIMGAGIVGALACTFADSVWFSTVEGEVYAMSAFFTAIVVWAMLKWEIVADQKYADRWILLIAYLVGLSIGVHLLNLLAIPALAVIYYYKKYKTSYKGIFYALLFSFLIVAIIQYGIIQELPTWAGMFDVFFVNSLHLPFGSGILVFGLLVIGVILYGFKYAKEKEKVLLHTSLLCLVFVLIGYSSNTLILIKSNFNPPINENNPSNIMNFVSYLKREQYGDRPLLFGQQFTAKLIDQEKGDAKYKKGKNKYEVYDYSIKNIYDPKHTTLFPRMYSPQPDHKEVYEEWVGAREGKKPTFLQNMKFFFSYQMNHMYWRYFLWNFSGRESDIQDAGWLAPWDSNKGLPASVTSNKSRNNFYMLPLILGIIGLWYHSKHAAKDSFMVFLLFFLTGIAIVIYLNQYPNQPRERDYAYAGSFIAFSIWIGLGVIALTDWFKKIIKSETSATLVAIVVSLSAPLIMGMVGWDDHNRSNRYTAVDSAKNLLNSCAKNAILFTNGDNDTFPLWYVQEVEGFRTDIRVCNLSLINTDWYISQMKRKAYESEPVPISLEEKDFQQGTNEYIPFVENKKFTSLPLETYMKMLKMNHKSIQIPLQSGDMINSFPVKVFEVPVDSAKVIANGTVSPKLAKQLSNKMIWKINKSSLGKQDIVIMDMIATNKWERPIYFAITVGPSSYLGLEEYFQLEGFAYRIVPIRTPGAKNGRVDTDLMYENLMKNFFWRHMDDPNVYYDENHFRFALNARNNYNRLASELLRDGKLEKAKEVIKHCLKILPDNTFPFDVFSTQFVSTLLAVKDDTLALKIARKLIATADENLNYYLGLDKKKINGAIARDQIGINWHILREVYEILMRSNKEEEAKKYEDMVRKHYEKLSQFM